MFNLGRSNHFYKINIVHNKIKNTSFYLKEYLFITLKSMRLQT